MAKITQSIKPVSAKDIKREWIVFDMNGKVLGRVVNQIAHILQGKHKTNYVPNLDMGDNVVVINAKKLVVTGKKADAKEYTYFSGYPGGLRKVSFSTMMNHRPEEIIRHAVAGMLPKNKLRDRRLARLHVYSDDKHPYGDKVKA